MLDDLEDIRTFCLEEDARLFAYVESLDDTALAEPLGTRSIPRGMIIAHVVIHGTQHRSEPACYLTDRGHSPDDLGLPDALASAWFGTRQSLDFDICSLGGVPGSWEEGSWDE